MKQLKFKEVKPINSPAYYKAEGFECGIVISQKPDNLWLLAIRNDYQLVSHCFKEKHETLDSAFARAQEYNLKRLLAAKEKLSKWEEEVE